MTSHPVLSQKQGFGPTWAGGAATPQGTHPGWGLAASRDSGGCLVPALLLWVQDLRRGLGPQGTDSDSHTDKPRPEHGAEHLKVRLRNRPPLAADSGVRWTRGQQGGRRCRPFGSQLGETPADDAAGPPGALAGPVWADGPGAAVPPGGAETRLSPTAEPGVQSGPCPALQPDDKAHPEVPTVHPAAPGAAAPGPPVASSQPLLSSRSAGPPTGLRPAVQLGHTNTPNVSDPEA